jgi:flagellar hook-length control protein FliK
VSNAPAPATAADAATPVPPAPIGAATTAVAASANVDAAAPLPSTGPAPNTALTPNTASTPITATLPSAALAPTSGAASTSPFSNTINVSKTLAAILPTARPASSAATAAGTGGSGDGTAPNGATDPTQIESASAEPAPTEQAPTQLSAAALVVQQAASSAAAPVDPAGTKTRDHATATDAVSATSDTVPIGMQPHMTTAAPGAPATETATTVAAGLHPATEQLAANMKQAVKDGSNQIQLELSPPSLGKIEVRLDFGHDGKLNAVISADRADTLNLLSSDSKSLTQSLRDAGVQVDSNSLSFNLRGDGSNPGQRQFAQSSSYGRSAGATAEDDDPVGAIGVIAASARSHAGNLDIQV